MIELYSGTIQLKTWDGRTLLCDPGQLQDDLHKAFRAAGIEEAWLADQVLAAIREEATVEGGLVDRESEEGFDRLVAKLLNDAGYPEVAVEYSRLKGVRETAQPCERHAWDAARVAALLAHGISASDALTEGLGELVARKLDALGFAQVSDCLIVEVAGHILANLAEAYRAEPGMDSGWLMPPGYWEAFFVGKPARMVASGAIKIHPVSELFPVLRITVDAERSLKQLGDERAHEEGDFTASWILCSRTIAETVDVLVREARCMIERNPHHPVLVAVKSLSSAAEQIEGPIARRRQKAIARQATRALGEAIAERGIHAIVSLPDPRP